MCIVAADPAFDMARTSESSLSNCSFIRSSSYAVKEQVKMRTSKGRFVTVTHFELHGGQNVLMFCNFPVKCDPEEKNYDEYGPHDGRGGDRGGWGKIGELDPTEQNYIWKYTYKKSGINDIKF